MTPQRTIAACLLLSWLATAASAAPLTLAEAWQAATANDPDYAARAAQLAADRAKRAQSRSMWLPSLAATGSVGQASSETLASGAAFSAPGFGSTSGVDFRTDINAGTSTRWSMQAEQPLFDADRLVQSRALRRAAQAGELRFRASEQELLLALARSYFDVMAATRAVQAIERHAAAARRAREQADARYRAGDVAVTELREAEAVADGLEFQLLSARNRLELARRALADRTGLSESEVPADFSGADPAPGTVPPLEMWLQRVDADNPQLAIQRIERRNAADAQLRFSPWLLPDVSIVGQAGRESLTGEGDFGRARSSNRLAAVALQVSVPLFTGGWRTAMRSETRALDRKAAAELERSRLQVAQQSRAAWLDATTAAARVAAARRAENSAATRLQATRLGREAGDRSTLELLAAEGAAEQASTERTQAQIERYMALLQLAAATGELTAEQLRDIDSYIH